MERAVQEGNGVEACEAAEEWHEQGKQLKQPDLMGLGLGPGCGGGGGCTQGVGQGRAIGELEGQEGGAPGLCESV